MKNETISRLILVLEIAAIILFHSLKSSTTQHPNSVVRQDRENTQENTPSIIKTSPPTLVHASK